MKLEQICKELGFSRDHLNKVDVIKIDVEQAKTFRDSIVPTFCFDNSLIVAQKEGFDTIVYGAALVPMTGGDKPIPHCWVKSCSGFYHDPTYEFGGKFGLSTVGVEYFALFEVPIIDFLELVRAIHGPKLASFCGLDFSIMCQLQDFQQYFCDYER